MLFMVISTPRAEPTSEARKGQQRFWAWYNALVQAGMAKANYVKTGRGAFIVLDVDSHETLHRLINEWAENVPSSFEVYPLVSKEHQERIAASAAESLQR